jgi:hypothetical protein
MSCTLRTDRKYWAAEKFSGPIIGGPLDGRSMASPDPIERIQTVSPDDVSIYKLTVYHWDPDARVWRCVPS